MAPMIPSCDDRDERRQGKLPGERSRGQGADLWVGRIEGAERLIALAQIGDIGTFT